MNHKAPDPIQPNQHATSSNPMNGQGRFADQVHLRIVRGDYAGAERMVRQALAADPNNCTARNALVVVMARTGRRDQAMQLLRETVEIQPGDPSAYYNLASILCGQGKAEEALGVLEHLFAKAQCDCPGAQKVFSLAFSLCQCARETLAAKHHDEACQAVEGFRGTIEALTGHPVVVHIEDLPASIGGYAETPLQRGGDRHHIHCNRLYPDPLRQHFLAHELMHIELEAEALAAGKARRFIGSNAGFKSQFILPRPQRRQLRRKGWDEAAIARLLASQVDRVLLSLFNSPVDLVVETRVHERFPVLASAQFLAFGRLLEDAPRPEAVLNGRGVMPRQLMLAGLALNDVRARLYDSMFGHTTLHALDETDTEVFPLASSLWECWRSAGPSLRPGDEFQLVDQFAEILGLRQAYEWSTVSATPSDTGLGLRPTDLHP
jgi:tetratricopeptide (TPR) repeat protein